MNKSHQELMRAAIEVAGKARRNGNHPFGAILADNDGKILLEAENTVVTENDCTGHAELNLMRLASRKFSPDYLAQCTLFTSTEPCPMCSGAIFWGNVRRVVFGLREESLYEMANEDSVDVLFLPCREVFARGRKPIEVIGPILEDEAKKVHDGFWS